MGIFQPAMGQRGVSRSKQLRWYLLKGIMFHMKHRCFCSQWRAIVMKTRFFLQTCEDDPLNNWKVGWLVAILNISLDPHLCCIFLCKEKSQWISIINLPKSQLFHRRFIICDSWSSARQNIRVPPRLGSQQGGAPDPVRNGGHLWPYKWPIYNWGCNYHPT